MSESGSMLHYRNKNRCEKLFCGLHMLCILRIQFPWTINWLSSPPCDWHLCLQNKSSHQVPECGDTFQVPTIGIPKAIYHYMTNTTKQQPTYQLFQNIMTPKNQLVNPPKMTKFTSICASSQFLLQLCKWPPTSEAGPMGQSEWI